MFPTIISNPFSVSDIIYDVIYDVLGDAGDSQLFNLELETGFNILLETGGLIILE
jgi:hypothetical protein